MKKKNISICEKNLSILISDDFMKTRKMFCNLIFLN